MNLQSNLIQQAFSISGPKIIDSSFFHLEQTAQIGDLRELSNDLGRILDLYRAASKAENLMITDEFEKEDRLLNERVIKPMISNLNELEHRVKIGRTKNLQGLTKNPRSIHESKRKFEDFIKRKDKILGKLLREHKVEDNIPFIGRLELPYIYNAFKTISSIPGVIIPYFGKDTLEENKDNDIGIFAKAVALSHTETVYILTRDSDFIRLSKEFYRNQCNYGRRYGFRVPKKGVNLIYKNNNGELTVLRAGQYKTEPIKESSLEVSLINNKP